MSSHFKERAVSVRYYSSQAIELMSPCKSAAWLLQPPYSHSMNERCNPQHLSTEDLYALSPAQTSNLQTSYYCQHTYQQPH